MRVRFKMSLMILKHYSDVTNRENGSKFGEMLADKFGHSILDELVDFPLEILNIDNQTLPNLMLPNSFIDLPPALSPTQTNSSSIYNN